MKNLFLTIMFACMALALMAAAPKPDVAASKPMSLHQFLRERNLTPNDNRLTQKAPSRAIEDDLLGNRIVVMEAQALEDIDENYSPILSDTVYSLGWNNNVFSWENGAYDDENCTYFGIDGFYGKYQLPLGVNVETGEPFLASYCLSSDTLEGTFKKLSGSIYERVDTVINVCFYTLDSFFNDDFTDLVGTVYDDGSIWFDGQGFFYTEEEHITYRKRLSQGTPSLYSRDTIAHVSPVLSNIYLLQPNGIHECKVQESQSSSSSNPYNFVADASTLQVIYWDDVSSGGHGGGGISTCGNGGMKDKPIGPRNPTRSSLSMLPQGNNDDTPVDDAPAVARYVKGTSFGLKKSFHSDITKVGIWDETNGGGGRVSPGKPFGPGQPRSIEPGSVINHTLPQGSINTANGDAYYCQNPVYMFQVNDSTVFVYNLFGFGSTINAMFIHEDGTMTLPGQALFYDPAKDDDFCNYTLEGDSLTFGNSGLATSDTISWGKTVPHGFINSYPLTFDDNRLFFIDGSNFILPGTPGTLLRGDVNNDGFVKVNDITVLISHLLTQDLDDSFDFNSHNSDITGDGQLGINDVSALINYLLTNTWPK